MSQRIATCPSCGAKYRIPDTFTKPKAACKKCGTAVDVPPLEAAASAPPPPPAPAPPPAGRPARSRRAAPAEPTDEEEARPSRSRGESGSRRSAARPARGKAGARPGAARRGGAGRGRSRRGGEDDEMETGGSKTTVIVIACVVVVLVAVAAFFLLQDKKKVDPTPTQVAEKPETPKVDPAEEARKRAQEEEAARRAEEEARKRAQEAAQPPAPAKPAPPEQDPNAPKPRPKPPAKIDLSGFAPLDFSPETSTEDRAEIERLAEVLGDPNAPGRQLMTSQNRLLALGYHAVPAVINLALKQDYATRDGVNQGRLFFQLLKDMCKGHGVVFRSTYNEDYEADPWENEYDINWNEQAVATWHRTWLKSGESKEKWEKEVAYDRKSQPQD